MSEIFENENEMNEYKIDLFDDEGNKQTVIHLDTVQIDGQDFVVCIPFKEEEGDEVDEVFILKMLEREDGTYELAYEEDLEVLDRAYEEFKARNADEFDFED
ncbi:MAG: DUF1292 domain-containing protein [Clostridia bacterium]|nr:DUF1292 domain-containing protein [Clostridia bacterium]